MLHMYAPRADFNDARFVVNRTLDALTSDLPQIHYWRHRGMHANWEQYFGNCGVHLNEVGMRKYVRAIKGAALFAAKQWDQSLSQLYVQASLSWPSPHLCAFITET